MKRKCNALVINVLYSAKSEVLSVFFPCFIPEYDAVFHAQKIAKRDCSFTSFTRFWAFYEASYPHFSALEPLKLHLCTLVPLPGTPVSHTPKHHLGYPILPFGVYFRYICLFVVRISRCKQCVTCKPVSEFLYLPLSIF